MNKDGSLNDKAGDYAGMDRQAWTAAAVPLTYCLRLCRQEAHG